MPVDWKEADVVCPFYRRLRLKQREIVCDSFDGAATVSALRFSSQRGMLEFLRTRCCDLRGCGQCRRHQLLMDIAAEDSQ